MIKGMTKGVPGPDNTLAFPLQGVGPGLTKREYFAAMAMQAILNDVEIIEYATYENTARHAVKMANELIKQLET